MLSVYRRFQTYRAKAALESEQPFVVIERHPVLSAEMIFLVLRRMALPKFGYCKPCSLFVCSLFSSFLPFRGQIVFPSFESLFGFRFWSRQSLSLKFCASCFYFRSLVVYLGSCSFPYVVTIASFASCHPTPPGPIISTAQSAYNSLVDGGCMAASDSGLASVAAELASDAAPAWATCLGNGGTVASCGVPCDAGSR
jgi:hypothetical protein